MENVMLISRVTGVVLLGGTSRRFGSNKSFAVVGGTPMLERVSETMTSIFDRVILITDTPEPYSHLGLPMFGDRIKGLGPIGGVYTALLSIQTDSAFITACDMPWLNRELIRHLIDVSSGFDVTVPMSKGRLEPLLAVYSRRCVPALKRCIDSGHRAVTRFYPCMNVNVVPESSLRRLDPDLKSLININRPQDLPEDEK